MRGARSLVLLFAVGAVGCQCLVPVVDPTCQIPCRKHEDCIDGECQPMRPEEDGGTDGGRRDGGSDAGLDGGDGGLDGGADAGAKLGEACGPAFTCDISFFARCELPDSGWPGGYCTQTCSSPGIYGACLCFIDDRTRDRLCLSQCEPDGGAGGCRRGYVCQARFVPPGVVASGCQPDCNIAVGICEPGQTCSDAGTCL